MDSKYIEQLLERYWQCETSLEEEAQLRAFFSEDNVPEHLLRYKNLFVYQQLQQKVHLGEDFDARVLAEIEVPVDINCTLHAVVQSRCSSDSRTFTGKYDAAFIFL